MDVVRVTSKAGSLTEVTIVGETLPKAVGSVPSCRGTDLSQHARLLSRVHDAVLSGQEPPAQPRTVVARSWSRVAAGGAHAGSLRCVYCRRFLRVGGEAFAYPRCEAFCPNCEPRSPRSPRTRASSWSLPTPTVSCSGAKGAKTVKRAADALGFAEGARWSEQSVGTNAIGTALIEDSAVQLFSAEHYAPTHHNWSCTGSPVHDPRTGRDPGRGGHQWIRSFGFIPPPSRWCAPRFASRRRRCGASTRLRSSACARGRHRCSRQGTGPALVVDEYGWVAGASGIAAPDRVAAPSAGKPRHRARSGDVSA